uniref:Uncharacterized protein n=1 Tax=Arundo donax TaxID=35708 RepID=A0A0A9B1M2_ARUDO
MTEITHSCQSNKHYGGKGESTSFQKSEHEERHYKGAYEILNKGSSQLAIRKIISTQQDYVHTKKHHTKKHHTSEIHTAAASAVTSTSQ